MENNWKGSKGDFGWIEQFDENIFDIISSEGSVIAKDIEGLEDAQMFSDAIKVRQQIYCSLPELLERCKRAEEHLKTIIEFNERTFTRMGPDYCKMINEAKEALNH